MRIDQPIYERLAQAASALPGRTIAEEAARRLEASFTMQKNHADQLQIESDMRAEAEEDLQRAQNRIEQLELLQLNFAADMQTAIEKAFARAGLIKQSEQS